MGSLRTLNTSCIAYDTTYATFPDSLASLGGTGAATSTSAGLIDSVLASGIKSGYTFLYSAGSGSPVYTYTITATPIVIGQTGQRMFFTDQSGVIRTDASGSGASVNSTPIGQ